MTLTDILNSELSDSLKIEIIKIFQKGGELSSKESDEDRIKRLIKEVIEPAAENGNPTALRFMNKDKSYYTFTEDDFKNGYNGIPGSRGNMYLGTYDDYPEYVIPGIQLSNDGLRYVSQPLSKENIELTISLSLKFPTAEDAKFFAENYHNYGKDVIPTFNNEAYSKDDIDYANWPNDLLGIESNIKWVKDSEAYTDKDNNTIYYTNPESVYHEYYGHMNPNVQLLHLLFPYYSNLNDDKLVQLGADLNFVKRENNDPNMFYQPEELLGRYEAAKRMLQKRSPEITKFTPEFFKELRKHERKYGDNMRDLLHMYNDDILSEMFNLKEIQLKKLGGTLNMTLDEILNSNISDSAKVEFMKVFAQGGVTEKDDYTKLNPTESITIGDQDFDVEIADSDEKRKIGLSKVKELKPGEGMFFVFESPVTNYFTMKETSIDLDIIFIDEDGEVIEVKTVKAFDKNPVECSQEYQYVLETTPNTGLQRGDELELDEELTEEDNDKIKKSRMLVLDPDGNVQMKLVGGERIISMIKTRQLIRAALKAYKSDEDKDYRRVGRIILQEFDALDSRTPQYVEKP